MLEVSAPHPRAQLDEVLVRVDDRALDDLRGLRVVTALVESDPAPAKQPVLPGLLKGEANLWNGCRRRNPTTTHAILSVSYTAPPDTVKNRSNDHCKYVQVRRIGERVIT